MRIRKPSLDNIFIVLILLTLGVGDLNGKVPLNLSEIIAIIYAGFQILEMLLKKRIVKCTPFHIFLIAYIFLFTFVINQDITSNSIKTFAGIVLYSLCFYYYVWKRKENLENIIVLLVKVTVFLALIGIIQEIGFIMHVSSLYSFEYLGIQDKLSVTGQLLRITSLTTEPAHLGYILIPGIHVALLHIFRMDNKKLIKMSQCIIILVAALLTFSFLTYIYVLISAFFIFFGGRGSFIKKIIVGVVFGIVLLFVSSVFSDSLQMVVDKYNSIFTLDQQLNTTNLSSFAVESNLKIAIQNAKDHYFVGSGLDTHKNAYYKYIYWFYGVGNIVMYLNADDAGSLYTRILSEFGELGIFSFFLFMFKYKIKNRLNSITVQANELAIVFIIGYALRDGNYLDPYFWLMVNMYIFTFNSFKKQKQNKNQESITEKVA